MKAVLYPAKNEVRLVDLPDPEPGPGEVVVRVMASGVCHTDYEVLKGNYGPGAFPVVPGHEYAGEIVAVGSDVSHVAIGDRVAVDPNVECGNCPACQRGWAHLCVALGAYGVTMHGGFAELSRVSAANVHHIGTMDFSRAALAEPMGCVLNGLDAVHAPWMTEALIFGAGPMGLLLGMTLRSAGIGHVAFCDISEPRLELAAGLGFEVAASGSADLAAWHHRADLAVDATGVPAVVGTLTNYIVSGGRGLLFGVCPSDAKVTLAPFEIFRRQLTLAGAHSLNHNIPRALAEIEKLGTQVDRIISDRMSLHQIADHLATSPPSSSLKVQCIAQPA